MYYIEMGHPCNATLPLPMPSVAFLTPTASSRLSAHPSALASGWHCAL